MNTAKPSSSLNTGGARSWVQAPAGDGGTGRTPRQRGISLAAPVALPGEQVPKALGPGQLGTAAELPEVQVGLGYAAPPFGPPVRQGASSSTSAAIRCKIAATRGRSATTSGHHQRLIGVIAVGAQGDRWGYWLVCR